MKGKISAFFRRIFLPNFSKIRGGVRKRRDTRKFPSRDTSELRATVDPRIPFAPAPAKPAIRQESDIKGEVCVCDMRTCWPNYSKIRGGVWKLRDTRKFPSRDTSELRATVDPRIPFAPAPAKPAIRQESDIKGEVCVCDMRTCWPNYSKIRGGVWKLRDTRKFHESIYGYGRQISGSPVEIWPSLTHRR